MSEYAASEYWAKKGEVDLYVYRKQRKEAPAGGGARPVLLLIHGSSFSSRPGYDLQVPGREGYSMMESCADMGFDVWTFDHEGYGKSTRTRNNSDIACGADDISAVSRLILKETGQAQMALYGQSSGSLRAALYAQREPEVVERLVLDAFVWTGQGSRTLEKRREGLAAYLASNVRAVTRDTYWQALMRDDPQGLATEPCVADALADQALQDGDSVPSGTFVDMCSKLPLVAPEHIHCPVYIMRGEHDGIATLDDILSFYKALPNPDKHFSVMANSAHIAPLGVNRQRFYHLLRWFLLLPGSQSHA